MNGGRLLENTKGNGGLLEKNFLSGFYKKYRTQIVFLIVPFGLFLIYISFFAVESYRSESIYVIRDLSTKENMGVDLSFFGGGSSSTKLDSQIVVNYLQSMDIFNRVDRWFNLTARYRSSETDILERLILNPASEDYLELFRKHLNIVYDELSGITSISFDSTDPELAQSVLRYLLTACEAFLNQLNHNTAQKKIAFLTEQLEENRVKWDQAVSALEAFQNKHRLVDPSASLAAYHNIIAGLEGDIINKTSQYNQLRRYMSQDTMEVTKLKNDIEEQKAALNKMKDKLSGPEKQHLNDLLFEYQRLKADVDFANEVYKNTLVQHDLNKMQTLQESKVFEVIAVPTLPDRHVYPRRIPMTMTAVILIVLGFKIIMLLWSVIKDHKD